MSKSTKAIAASVPVPKHSWLVLLGCIAVVAVGFVSSTTRAFAALLTAGVWGFQLAMGALIFIAIFVVSGARWWRPTRGRFLDVANMLPVPVLLLAVVTIVGMPWLYAWSDHAVAESSHLIHHKAGWLNRPFFIARAVGLAVIWFTFLWAIGKRLRQMFREPTDELKGSLARVSAGFIVVMGLTVSVGFWDWTMSLEAEWFSTMYSVYGFAGCLQGGMAATTVLAILWSRQNPNSGIDAKVRHDLGKLLFGFCFFWAYIWFCQFMLIWYANLPEEVGYYVTRFEGGWTLVFWLAPLLNFIIPFLWLLSARVKKNENALLQAALFVLFARFVDVLVMVEPAKSEHVVFPIYHLAATVAVAVAMLLFGNYVVSRNRPAVSGGKRAAAAH